jgi:LytS/YehU family sensor histidine kinase
MNFKIIDVAQVGIFSALAFVGAYLFIAIPNVEIITAIIFVAGVYLGPRKGLLVGLVGQSLYSTLNPYGMSPPPLFIAQVLNRMLLGYVGGCFPPFLKSQRRLPLVGFLLGVTGLLLTWLFDITTDFSFFFVSGFSIEQMKTTFTLGLPFYLLHGLVNMFIFALVLPVVLRGLLKTAKPS